MNLQNVGPRGTHEYVANLRPTTSAEERNIRMKEAEFRAAAEEGSARLRDRIFAVHAKPLGRGLASTGQRVSG